MELKVVVASLSHCTRKQIYIRIGYPKTGATSTQVWLARHSDELASQDALYPLAGRGEGDYSFGHHRISFDLLNATPRELAASWPDMEALRREISETTASKVIVSSEGFCNILDETAIDLLASELSEFEIKIVCYLRRQDDLAVSYWATNVMHYREKRPLSACLLDPTLDFAQVVERWAHSFGSEAILLRPFEASQLSGGNPVMDMLAACGIDASIAADAGHENRSAPAHIVTLVSLMNEQEIAPATTDRLRALGLLAGRDSKQFVLITPQQRAALLARHADGNASLARTYLASVDGCLFNDLTIRCEPQLRQGPAAALELLVNDIHAAVGSPAKPATVRHDADPHQHVALPDTFRSMTDEAWLRTLLQTTVTPEIQGFRFPSFPSTEVQVSFVGAASEAAVREAFNFYLVSKGYAHALGMPLSLNNRFLDFGVGWGRFTRIFWKDVAAANLFGCDVDPDVLTICRATGVPGTFDLLYPHGRLPYPDQYFSGGIAYSVFTHLAEKAHLHWMHELARVMQPGAVFCMTLEPRRFADFIEQLPENPASAWHAALRAYAAKAHCLRSQFDAGQFVYLPTGGGDYREATEYGDAIVPPAFIEREWGDAFALRAYIDEPSPYWQAIAVMQRI